MIMKKYFFLLFTIYCLLPLFAHAYSAEVFVNTGNEAINAIEGTVHIPRGVNVTSIETGRSVVLIWIQQPTLEKESQTISFSGISPGGFQGKQPLFSFSGELSESDLRNFTYSGVRAFKNDGDSTPVVVTLAAREGEVITDTTPPELFTPIISRTPDLFDDRPFASFLAQDKESGIERYDYAYTWLFSPSEGKWRVATSPLEISKLGLFQKINIKAVDRAGNYRTVSISGSYRYATILFGIIIILLCVLFFSRRSARSLS